MKNLFFILFACIIISCKPVKQSTANSTNTTEKITENSPKVQSVPQSQEVSGPGNKKNLEINSIANTNGYAINVQNYGVKPGNDPKANSKAFKEFLAGFRDNFIPSIYIPAGNYNFSETIELAKSVHLFGDGGSIFNISGTRLHFPQATTGIRVRSTETTIERIGLFGNRNIKGQYFGIYASAHVVLKQVAVKGFADNGFLIYGNLEEGTDVSSSYLEHCQAAENGADGLFIGKVDGNACTVIGFDARDNDRYGIQDDSFLGNYFFACMCHNNKKGHYYVRDKNNARSTFVACYAESDGPPNDFSPLTTVVGGFLANGYDKHDGKGVIKQ
jgi:hypothetical protein